MFAYGRLLVYRKQGGKGWSTYTLGCRRRSGIAHIIKTFFFCFVLRLLFKSQSRKTELLKIPPLLKEKRKSDYWDVRFPPITAPEELFVSKAMPLTRVEWKAHHSFLWTSVLAQIPSMLVKHISFMSESMTEMGPQTCLFQNVSMGTWIANHICRHRVSLPHSCCFHRTSEIPSRLPEL